MKYYSTLHIYTNSNKGTGFYCCSTFHSHNRVFNNEQKSYLKMSVKQHLTCSWAVLFTSGDKQLLACSWAVLFTSGDKQPLVCSWAVLFTSGDKQLLAYSWAVLFTSGDKQLLAYSWAVLFTSANNRYIWTNEYDIKNNLFNQAVIAYNIIAGNETWKSCNGWIW